MQAIVQYTVTQPLLTMMSIKGECLLLDIVHSHLQYMNGDSRIPKSTLYIKSLNNRESRFFVLKLQMVQWIGENEDAMKEWNILWRQEVFE